jgi:hypothetical protein
MCQLSKVTDYGMDDQGFIANTVTRFSLLNPASCPMSTGFPPWSKVPRLTIKCIVMPLARFHGVVLFCTVLIGRSEYGNAQSLNLQFYFY